MLWWIKLEWVKFKKLFMKDNFLKNMFIYFLKENWLRKSYPTLICQEIWSWLYSSGGSKVLWAWTFMYTGWTFQYVSEGILSCSTWYIQGSQQCLVWWFSWETQILGLKLGVCPCFLYMASMIDRRSLEEYPVNVGVSQGSVIGPSVFFLNFYFWCWI